MVDKARLKQALAKYEKCCISDWNQGGRDDVGTGICMGMCLDWLRRIFNRKGSFGTAREPRSHIYNPDEESILTQFAAQTRGEKRFDKQKLAQKTMRMSQESTLQTELNDDIDALAADFKRAQGRNPNEAEAAAIALHFFRSNLPSLQKKAYEHFQFQWQLNTQKPATFWSAAKDKRVNYNSIRIDTSAMPRFGKDNDEALNGAALHEGYVWPAVNRLAATNSAGILSAGRLTSSGHDVAFHVPAAGDTFYYFDPNLGEFCFKKDGADFRGFWIEIWDSVYLERNYVWALMARFFRDD